MAETKKTTPPSTGSGVRADTYEEAHKLGFLGEKVDPVPNEHYTTPDPHTDPPKFSGPDLK